MKKPTTNPKNSGKNSGKKAMPEGRRWKPGESGNPNGRPPGGTSWAEIIKTVGESDIDSILAVIDTRTALGKKINALPRRVQLKYLAVVSVYVTLIDEPSAGLFNALMDRDEGKVKEQVDLTGETLTDGERWTRIQALIDKAYGRKEAAERNSSKPL